MEQPIHGDAPVLVTRGLTKSYGRSRAVDAVDVTLRPGRIHGLIGRNGAGKTTLMRLVAGLSIPTSGAIELFGARSRDELARARRRLGVLIEEPGLNLQLSARENLELHRLVRGIPSRTVSDELLELVGLADVGRKRTRDFSLGMRQRLGIAISLVAAPELLLLDEPVNGLDPGGVVEVRRLLRELAATRNITILISSHNLPELYQTATDYVIVEAGRVRQELTLEELEQRMGHTLRIECASPERLATVLDELGLAERRVLPDGQVRIETPVADREALLRALVAHEVYPTTFVSEGQTLEEYFLSVVGATDDHATTGGAR